MRSTRLVLAHYRFGAILQCRLGLYDKPGRLSGRRCDWALLPEVLPARFSKLGK